MSSLHRISVLGRELQVKSTALPATVKEIETFVNAKVAEVAASVTGGDSQVVAILTLMTIAEAYLALAKEQEQGSKRVGRLIEKLDHL